MAQPVTVYGLRLNGLKVEVDLFDRFLPFNPGADAADSRLVAERLGQFARFVTCAASPESEDRATFTQPFGLWSIPAPYEQIGKVGVPKPISLQLITLPAFEELVG